MGMFRLEFCLPPQELIHGSNEILQVFLILPHQVFGPLQELFRGQLAGTHGAAANAMWIIYLLRISEYWRSLPAKSWGLQRR